MEKLSQHLNFRDSDADIWNAIDVGSEVQADSQQVIDDAYDQSKHMYCYNSQFSEGRRACVL